MYLLVLFLYWEKQLIYVCYRANCEGEASSVAYHSSYVLVFLTDCG